MTVIQIALGGITRLTGSGLSITDWDVVTGTLPPMSDAAWQTLFAKYKTTPQFQLLNFDFNIDNFKFIFFWEWFHRLWARCIGLVFAFGAVAFTLREGFLQELTPLQHWGDLFGVGGGIFWAITTIVIRTTAMAKASAEKMLFYQVGVSSIALLLMSYFSNEVWSWNFSAFALTSLLIQTTAGAFVSYLAWMWLLARYPATKIGTFVFLTPVFALIFGALWLNEAVTLSLIGALAMVGVGIALVNKRKPA